MKSLALFLLSTAVLLHARQYTRGIGIYPGDPKEYTGPTLVLNAKTYRNLALYRPAYQSSAYDYNLTAQLITDGIHEQQLPQWIAASTSDAGTLDKQQREVFLDGNVTSSIEVSGENPWVQFDFEGGGEPPEVDRLELYLRRISSPPAGGWTYIVSGSDDRVTWKELGRATGTEWPSMNFTGPSFHQRIAFAAPSRNRSYRIQLVAPNLKTWGVSELVLFDRDKELHVAGPYKFTSAWMSAGSGEEWVYVDLGGLCTFDRITLSWVRRAAEGAIQISNDATQWQTLQPLPSDNGFSDDIRLPQPAHGRYVRILMTRPAQSGGRYILSDLAVYGRGGPVAMPQPASPVQTNGQLDLAAGDWRLQRESLVSGGGEQISIPGFAASDWLIATVPGTVLTSYLNDGAIPDPNFGDNQYAISDSFFCANFWYRDEFIAPAVHDPGQHLWLNFDGVNWKADIYLNGQKLGGIDGGFMRGRFDVTALLHPGEKNALAVRILANDNPGGTKDKVARTLNGGALGRDNPTYHASAGWDWMPTIRGRNIGIWSNVSLTTSNAVTIENPLVTTTLLLPDTTHADITIQATLHNQESHPVSGTLRANFGAITIEKPVTLDPSATQTIEFAPSTQPALHLINAKLWWPAGYGEPNLYPVTITFLVAGKISDTTSFQTGIRQFAYSEEGGLLKIWINGRHFIPHGGNWGFPESMLRYRSREYEIAMRYHRDEHFNMIRNWVGQTGDEAMYEAADRNGIVVWQDFWLANPWDGPNPDNNDLFLINAKDYLLRIRNHASLGIFCGRNEGFPPQPIDDGLRNLVVTLEPQSHYISSSADGPVSGRGPYRVEPLRYYFEHAPSKLHSEMGAPNVVDTDSLRRTMPESAMWPQGSQWPLHDFHENNPFQDAIAKQFGGATSIADWEALAQFVDYDAYRGMFEGQSVNRQGLLIWMSHPAWPSLLWQTYDYFFDTDASYFAAKKASEPLHIQWNAANDNVEVVNYSAGEVTNLTVHAEVLNIDGTLKWEKSATGDSHEDSTIAPLRIDFPAGLSRTHFIRLTLSQAGKVISSNFYLHGVVEGDYQGIRDMPKAEIKSKTRVARRGSQWQITTELRNTSANPALLVRAKVVREKAGDPILPAIYDDNYIALMPGESRTLHIEFENADIRGQHPRVIVQGYNLANIDRPDETEAR